MKPYAIHSFFSAYAHIKRDIPNGEKDIGFPPRWKDIRKGDDVLAILNEIADAHETKDVDGKYGEYVSSAINTTTKAAQRRARTKVLAKVLDPE